jgi:hypothetical protein
MTITSVAIDDPIQAVTMNELIANINDSPYRLIATVNGNWQVPAGCHKFKVTLCGGGGYGNFAADGGSGEGSYIIPGAPGGSSPMVSAVFSGYDIGTTFVMTVGAAAAPNGTGGTTSFGTVLISTGASSVANGSITTAPAGALRHLNTTIMTLAGVAYGSGGPGDSPGYTARGPGGSGVIVIEF